MSAKKSDQTVGVCVRSTRRCGAEESACAREIGLLVEEPDPEPDVEAEVEAEGVERRLRGVEGFDVLEEVDDEDFGVMGCAIGTA